MKRLALLISCLTVGLMLGGCPVPIITVSLSGPSDSATSDSTNTTAVAGEVAGCLVPADEEAWMAEVLQYVNDERTSRGLNALEPDAALAEQAAAHACDMIHYNFFDHINPVTGSTPVDRVAAAGFKGVACGENIAAGQRTPVDVVTGWMNSPGHRANILNASFTRLGVGIRQGGSYGLYWVQLFAGP